MQQIEYSRPVLVVYNPKSGTKRDVRAVIRQGLKEAGIACEFYETSKSGDAVERVRGCNLGSYSAIAVVGGDGTVHEVVNGMLLRADQQVVPIVHVPNGSRNAFAMNHCIRSVESAMEALKKGHVVKQDVMRCEFDRELCAASGSSSHTTYSTLNADIGFVAHILSKTPALMKQLLGPVAYFITLFRLLFKKELVKLDVELDDGSVRIKEVEGSMFNITNQVHNLHNSISCAIGLINDGLNEIRITREPFKSFGEFLSKFNQFKLGGINQYFGDVYRFSTLKICNRNYDPEGYLLPQAITVDGELKQFTHSVKFEVIKEGLQVICDIDRVIDEKYTLGNRGPPEEQPKSRFGLFLIAAALCAAAATAYLFLSQTQDA